MLAMNFALSNFTQGKPIDLSGIIESFGILRNAHPEQTLKGICILCSRCRLVRRLRCSYTKKKGWGLKKRGKKAGEAVFAKVLERVVIFSIHPRVAAYRPNRSRARRVLYITPPAE